MSESLIGIQLNVGGMLLKYVHTAAESYGTSHVQEARYPPASTKPPSHRHPKQEETFSILEGSMIFDVAGNTQTVAAGEEVKIPRAVAHSAFNPGPAHALVLWETRPALRTAEFFQAMSAATRGRAKPSLLDAAAILNEFRDELELERPPAVIQRVVFGCLAPFGRVHRA